MKTETFDISSVDTGELEKKSGHGSNFENIKNIIAEKLHTVAGEISEKSETPELQPIVGDYGRQASHLLDQSAEYVRHFDFQRLNDQVNEFVREKPGLSLLLAGAAGLIIGAMVRRR